MKDPLGINPSKGNKGTTQSKEKFIFTLCGSLIPFTRANTQWVFIEFHIAL